MTTKVTKKKSGWSAEDLIDFNGPQKLHIETYKSHSGALVTRAAVNTYTDTGYTHAFGLSSGGDYSERVAQSSARGTEKAVKEQHAEAMAKLADIEARARAHYAKHGAAR